jgi:hypothetical protein
MNPVSSCLSYGQHHEVDEVVDVGLLVARQLAPQDRIVIAINNLQYI